MLAFKDGKPMVKRSGGKKMRLDNEWLELVMYPSIEVDKPMILLVRGMHRHNEIITIRTTSDVEFILTGRNPE